jgi:hypothetical protein
MLSFGVRVSERLARPLDSHELRSESSMTPRAGDGLSRRPLSRSSPRATPWCVILGLAVLDTPPLCELLVHIMR